MYELIPFISFRYPCIQGKIDLMIDSGSQGNVIKSHALPHGVKVNHNERIWIKGISVDPFITIGTVNIKLFNQSIKFNVIQDSMQIPYNSILGVEFINKNKAIIDFDNKNLCFSNHRIPFKQNNGSQRHSNTDKIFSVNQLLSEQTLPLINGLNCELKYIGQFLIDSGSERNLIKIGPLLADCEIDINKIVLYI